MDERTRVWQEIGLHLVLRTPRDVPETIEEIPRNTISPPQQSLVPDTPVADPSCQDPFIFYRRRLHPPIAALITYEHLDTDFRGQPYNHRLRLVHAIIEKAMPWNPKEVAFWPMSIDPPPQIPDEDVEAALLHVTAEFKPKYILDFGGSFTGHLTNRSQNRHADTADSQLPKLVLLPSLEDMLPDNKSVKKAAWDIIRRLTP